MPGRILASVAAGRGEGSGAAVGLSLGARRGDLQGHPKLPTMPVPTCPPLLFPAICACFPDLLEAQAPPGQIPGKPGGP